MMSFRWIWINCFIRFKFLAEVATNLQKCTILGTLRTITQEAKRETRQMVSFFSSTFSALTVCDIHSCIWKLAKFIFMRFPLRSILACKIHNSWRWKLWDQNFVPFDSGNIQIKESKETGFTFSIETRTKFFWSHSLLRWVLQLFEISALADFQWLDTSILLLVA